MTSTTNTIHYHEYDETEISLLLRDLSKNESLNVKTLLDNYTYEEKQKKKEQEQKKKKKRKSKGKESNKAEKIRAQNIKNNAQKLEDEDKARFSHYDNLEAINFSIIDDIKFFKTEYGKNRMKYKFLDIALVYALINFIGTIAYIANSINENNFYWIKDTITHQLFKDERFHLIYATESFNHDLTIDMIQYNVPVPPTELYVTAAQDSMILTWKPSPETCLSGWNHI